MNLTIGQLATRAGVNVQTVRYYERRGLMPAPPRSRSGYRQYDRSTLARIQFIKRAQALGFSLSEVAVLLDLRVDPDGACAAVETQAQAKIDTIDNKVRELGRMRDALERLVAACETRAPTGDCPILMALEDDDGQAR